jgi:hypothetical protein
LFLIIDIALLKYFRFKLNPVSAKKISLNLSVSILDYDIAGTPERIIRSIPNCQSEQDFAYFN